MCQQRCKQNSLLARIDLCVNCAKTRARLSIYAGDFVAFVLWLSQLASARSPLGQKGAGVAETPLCLRRRRPMPQLRRASSLSGKGVAFCLL